ncbi:MAG: glycoside hydrolase family 44 protein [Myxococcota bacterium]|nr:glycoside hydrolase family 44 protein [Myxococcota bacterium]
MAGADDAGAPAADAGMPSGRDGATVRPSHVEAGPVVPAGDPGQVDVTFAVRTDQNVHAISPFVYGVNDESVAARAHAPIVRSGGNRATAFNWENNASNAGSDYQFENDDLFCHGGGCVPGADAPGGYLRGLVERASAAGAAVLVTVPIVDYVSADTSPRGDVRGSGANYLQTRFKQNRPAKGSAFASTPDVTDGFVYQDEMVHWLLQAEPNATLLFQLDNEPDLWSATHAEVHPNPVTYAELSRRSIDYAAAVKAVSPGAPVWGPANYGWQGFVDLQGASDAKANGDFLVYWLEQMKAAESVAGKRLIDGLDLHWYPEAVGDGKRIIVSDATPGLVAAREQAPRSLWDATYVENSWIAQVSTKGAIALLPLVQTKITQHYPGTKLSFSEWNYGGGGDISGAIAAADVLGIFGREGVDMAMMWPQNSDESYANAAFAAFRNYDGRGAAFGDTSVAATTTDVPGSSVYAAIDSTDPSRVVVIAINKGNTDRMAGVRISHSTVYASASTYAITAAGGAKPVPGRAIQPVATNAFRYMMPAQSITVIVPSP